MTKAQKNNPGKKRQYPRTGIGRDSKSKRGTQSKEEKKRGALCLSREAGFARSRKIGCLRDAFCLPRKTFDKVSRQPVAKQKRSGGPERRPASRRWVHDQKILRNERRGLENGGPPFGSRRGGEGGKILVSSAPG